MFSHYLSVALRQMRNAPFAASVSVITLAVGLVCFVAAYAIVAFWDRADSFFANAERTYVLTQGGLPMPRNPHAAQYVETDFPELETVARAMVLSDEYPVAAGDRALRLAVVSVDPGFLDIFDLPFIAGDPASALQATSGVVVTRDAALRLFGSIDVLDRPLLLDASRDLVVTGVVDAIPEPSHMGRSQTAPLPFDLLVSWRLIEDRDDSSSALPENWVSGTPVITYLLLPEDGSLSKERLVDGLRGFAERHAPPNIASDVDLSFGVLPVTELLGIVSTQQRLILLILGGLILAVGCVNFANLGASRAAFRAQDAESRRGKGLSNHYAAPVRSWCCGDVGALRCARVPRDGGSGHRLGDRDRHLRRPSRRYGRLGVSRRPAASGDRGRQRLPRVPPLACEARLYPPSQQPAVRSAAHAAVSRRRAICGHQWVPDRGYRDLSAEQRNRTFLRV